MGSDKNAQGDGPLEAGTRMMELRYLQTFLIVVEELTFSRSAGA